MNNGRKAVFIPVPYGKTVTYRKGTEKGPAAILKALNNVESFDEELNMEITGFETAPFLKVTGLIPEEMIDAVDDKVTDVLNQKKLPVVLGGEHTVSIGAVKAMKKKYKDLSVLCFDAHYDLRGSYQRVKYNHACSVRRLLEIAPVAEVGMRSISKEEFIFLKEAECSLKVISMLDIFKNPGWYNGLNKYLKDNVYISVDLDVFDPSIMPSVGTPEPGGLLWHDFLNALRNIVNKKNIVGFDVVELCPIKDMIAPDFMAAKLIYKILGYIYACSK